VSEKRDDNCRLLELCLTGQESGWKEMEALIRRLAYCLVISRYGWRVDELDDLVQEMLVATLEDNCRILRTYDPRRAQLTTYLGVILRRLAARCKQHRSGEHSLDLLWQSPQFMDSAQTSSEITEARDLAVRVLTLEDQLILRYTTMGYKAAEIAELLSQVNSGSFTATTVRQRRCRALARLRCLLSKAT
jgi:hypothetical protein